MANLYNWYLEDYGEYTLLHGVVTGHHRLPDSTFIHTSPIKSIELLNSDNLVIVNTKNSKYRCYIKDMDIAKCKEFLNNSKNTKSEWIKTISLAVSNYSAVKREEYHAGSNSILLVIGNNTNYYFKSLIINKNDSEFIIDHSDIHIGMFQDSVLLMSNGLNKIDDCNFDIRYFPYQNCNIQFYSFKTDGLPLFIQNCGDATFNIEVNGNVYIVNPKDKIEINSGNAIKGAKLTSTSDLYSPF